MNFKDLSEKFKAVLNEENNQDVNIIWNAEMRQEPVIETGEGPVYLQPSEDGKYIQYGIATNTGMIIDGEVEYDFDFSLDSNLQNVVDEIFDKYGAPMEDGSEPYSDSKYDRLSDLLIESLDETVPE